MPYYEVKRGDGGSIGAFPLGRERVMHPYVAVLSPDRSPEEHELLIGLKGAIALPGLGIRRGYVIEQLTVGERVLVPPEEGVASVTLVIGPTVEVARVRFTGTVYTPEYPDGIEETVQPKEEVTNLATGALNGLPGAQEFIFDVESAIIYSRGSFGIETSQKPPVLAGSV